jgi:predicted nucleotidyltransferase
MADETLVEALRSSLEELGTGIAGCEILAAWLFGSQARGTARQDSDVDVAILLDGVPEPRYPPVEVQLGAELTRRLGREVDVVVLNRAPPELVHRALRDGELLLERDRAARVRFEVHSRALFNLRPSPRIEVCRAAERCDAADPPQSQRSEALGADQDSDHNPV